MSTLQMSDIVTATAPVSRSRKAEGSKIILNPSGSMRITAELDKLLYGYSWEYGGQTLRGLQAVKTHIHRAGKLVLLQFVPDNGDKLHLTVSRPKGKGEQGTGGTINLRSFFTRKDYSDPEMMKILEGQSVAEFMGIAATKQEIHEARQAYESNVAKKRREEGPNVKVRSFNPPVLSPQEIDCGKEVVAAVEKFRFLQLDFKTW